MEKKDREKLEFDLEPLMGEKIDPVFQSEVILEAASIIGAVWMMMGLLNAPSPVQ